MEEAAGGHWHAARLRVRAQTAVSASAQRSSSGRSTCGATGWRAPGEPVICRKDPIASRKARLEMSIEAVRDVRVIGEV